MNGMNGGDVMWKCPNCDRLISNNVWSNVDQIWICRCGGAHAYQFDRFVISIGDEIETEFEKRLATLTRHEVYDMGYDDGSAAAAYGGDELDAAYRRGHNDGRVESAQLRAIEDTIDTMCAGGESSTPTTPDDIGEAYDCGYTDGAFNAYPDGYNTGHDDGYRSGKHTGYICGKDEGHEIGYATAREYWRGRCE